MIAVCVLVTYQYVLSRMVIDALIVLTPQVEKHHVTTVHARESCACSDVFWIFLNWSKFVWLINFGTAVSVLEFRSVWILRENDSFRWDWRCMCCREWSATYGMNGHKIYIRKYSFRVNRLNPTFVFALMRKSARLLFGLFHSDNCMQC